MARGVPTKGFRMTAKKKAEMTNKVLERKPCMFSINDRFSFVTDMVTMLSNGDQASVVITGPGGLGKSHTVTEALRNNGFQDVSALDDFNAGDYPDMKVFRVVKGYSTPKGLYRTLYENRNSVLVFDDTDSVLRDPVSLNLLKAALDSYSTRIISYKADIRDEDLPNVFEFKGRVVFISNLSSNSIDQAIISRSMSVDLSMTNMEKVERMRYLLTQNTFMPEYSESYKTDALNLISNIVDSVRDLSLRSLIQVTKIRASNPNNRWRELATYSLCG